MIRFEGIIYIYGNILAASAGSWCYLAASGVFWSTKKSPRDNQGRTAPRQPAAARGDASGNNFRLSRELGYNTVRAPTAEDCLGSIKPDAFPSPKLQLSISSRVFLGESAPPPDSWTSEWLYCSTPIRFCNLVFEFGPKVSAGPGEEVGSRPPGLLVTYGGRFMPPTSDTF